jgi:hypothetical protein
MRCVCSLAQSISSLLASTSSSSRLGLNLIFRWAARRTQHAHVARRHLVRWRSLSDRHWHGAVAATRGLHVGETVGRIVACLALVMIGRVLLLRWAVVHGGVRDNDMHRTLALERWGGLRDGGAKPEYLIVSSEVTLFFTGGSPRREWTC